MFLTPTHTIVPHACKTGICHPRCMLEGSKSSSLKQDTVMFSGKDCLPKEKIVPTVETFSDRLFKAWTFNATSIQKELERSTNNLSLPNKIVFLEQNPQNFANNAAAVCEYKPSQKTCTISLYPGKKDKLMHLPVVTHEFTHALQYNTKEVIELCDKITHGPDGLSKLSRYFQGLLSLVQNYEGQACYDVCGYGKSVYFLTEEEQSKTAKKAAEIIAPILTDGVLQNENIQDKKSALAFFAMNADMEAQAHRMQDRIQKKLNKKNRIEDDGMGYAARRYDAMAEAIRLFMDKTSFLPEEC